MKGALTSGGMSRARGSALEGDMATPPAPDMHHMQGPLMAPNAPPGQGGQPPQAPPAPTHAQTVATLRLFQAVISELNQIAKNPDLGKASVKSQIIDGTSKLVAERLISPAAAVTTLATVPEKPYEQKVWIQNQMQQTMVARAAVLAHHAAAFAGQGPQPTPDTDGHMDDVNSMVASHYGQK
jgi:hypothetical protein